MQWCWMWDTKFFCIQFQKLHTPAHIAILHAVARSSSQVSMSARNWAIFVQVLFQNFQGFLPGIINVTDSPSTDVLCLERIIEKRVLSFPSACFRFVKLSREKGMPINSKSFSSFDGSCMFNLFKSTSAQENFF